MPRTESVARIAVAIVPSGRDDTDHLRTTLEALSEISGILVSSITVYGFDSGLTSTPFESINGVEVAFARPAARSIDFELIPAADYVVVLRAGDSIKPASFAELRREIRNGVAQPLYALCSPTKYLLNQQVTKNPLVVIERDRTSVWTGSCGYLLSWDLARQCENYDLRGSLGLHGLWLNALLHAGLFRPLVDAVQIGTPLEDALSIEACLYDPAWYTDLNDIFEDLFSVANSKFGAVPAYFQISYLYLLQWRFIYNRNTANKAALRNHTQEYFQGVRRVLAGVNDDVIGSPSKLLRINFSTKLFLLRLKGSSNNLRTRFFGSDIGLSIDGATVTTAASVRVEVDAMEMVGNELHISGRYAFPIAETSRLSVRYRHTEFSVAGTARQTATTAFGEELYRSTAFDVIIPLRRGKAGSIRFLLVDKANQTEVLLDPRFTRWPAKLTNDKTSYWNSGDYIFMYRARRISVTPSSAAAVRSAEVAYLRFLFSKGDALSRRAAWLRICYFATRGYHRRRRVWVYFDKIYKGGDNGEYAFKYARAMRDGISKYYLLGPETPDAARFEAAGTPYLRYGSLRAMIVFLNATTVLTTHINPPNFGGFAGGLERYFRGLFRFKVICIQHGLSVQDLSGTLNQSYDNTSLFCLASPVEEANLRRPEYGYKSEQLVITGLARYDGLLSDAKKRILIMPTWRNYLAAPYQMGRPRGYSERFKKTPYYAIYNTLLTDSQLLGTAAEFGYEIVLLLHPVTSAQASDFATSEQVTVVPSTGEIDFELILRQGSLLITDYSGVQFDFAYMNKPVVYYQPAELPPSYAQGAYEYDSMALGPIARHHRDLVAIVCDYMRSDCQVDKTYQARIDEFFTFRDRNNSARIYEAAKALSDASTVSGRYRFDKTLAHGLTAAAKRLTGTVATQPWLSRRKATERAERR